MTVREVVLEVKDLRFSYGARPALTGVSLELRDGEMAGVIGPNGSGKSTLVRLISGSLRPLKGRIRVCGEDTSRLSREELARRIAVVPQSPYLPESMSAGEVVLLGRTPHLRLLQAEGPRDLAVAERVMKLCGVWEMAHRPIGELSGGERQRAVIARALAQEPKLLLLDEPASNLDIYHQVAVLDLIARLCREHKLAVLVVEHDLNLAAQYCSRLLVLREGGVVVQGPPDEVITVETIGLAYGAEVCVVGHPRNNRPVALVTGRQATKEPVEETSKSQRSESV